MDQSKPETPPHLEEMDDPTPPRIYVASLSDYNAGWLHGTWVSAAQDPQDIHTEIQRMLATSRQPLAEEWAIHDYEGFAHAKVSEYADIHTVARIAHGIAEHGDAFAAWVAHSDDTSTESLDKFGEAYLGRWGSIRDYAEQYAADIGLSDDHAPEWAQPYLRVDLELLARDLEIELAVSDAEKGGIHVFDPHV